MKKRTLENILKIALNTFPVVLLNGASNHNERTISIHFWKFNFKFIFASFYGNVKMVLSVFLTFR